MALFIIGILLLIVKVAIDMIAKVPGSTLIFPLIADIAAAGILYGVAIAIIVYGFRRNAVWAVISLAAVSLLVLASGGSLI